jgi:NAD(P)-dependent dehydrogenase (short-subunit alcohol dehydrogenase family)
MTKPHYDFTGKVALVTGAASGIGKATATNFARSGACVVLADLHADAGRRAADQLREKGADCVFLGTDVTDEEQVEQLVATSVAHFGSLDIAFNNAGIEGRPGAVTTDLSYAEWCRIIDTNLTGVWLCMKHELQYMAGHGGGSIVNTSSVAGLGPAVSAGVAYTASKHGVIGLTKTADREFSGQGIRINAICPGGVDTPLLERIVGQDTIAAVREQAGSLASPNQIADAVLWLCSDAASFISGQALVVDGGRSITAIVSP